MLVFIVPNTILSFLGSTYEDLYQQAEIPLYRSENILFLVLLMLVVLAFSFGIARLVAGKGKIPQNGMATADEHLSGATRVVRILKYIALAVIFAINIFFIINMDCGVACDSGSIAEIATDFVNGNYAGAFNGNSYLSVYPFQIGITAYFQIFIGIFGTYAYLAMQIVNALLITLSVLCFFNLLDLCGAGSDICVITYILSIPGLLTLYLYSSFLYGDVPGLCFGIFAIYFCIKLDAEWKVRYIVASSISMALAIILKSNSMILLIAIGIVVVIRAIISRKPKLLIVIGCMLLTYIFASTGIKGFYASKAGVDKLPSGAPKTTWIAMGLQENDAVAYGAYNGFNYNTYVDSGCDNEASNEIAVSNIKESISGFLSNPKHAVKFFYLKFKAMWNMPDYNSLLQNEWYSRHSENVTDIGNWFIYEGGRTLLYWIMNVAQSLVLLGTAIWGVYVISHSRSSQCFDEALSLLPFVLAVTGGYLFHMFWEAQSRYAMPYFVLCFPMAVIGWGYIYRFVFRGASEGAPEAASETAKTIGFESSSSN